MIFQCHVSFQGCNHSNPNFHWSETPKAPCHRQRNDPEDLRDVQHFDPMRVHVGSMSISLNH